MPGLLFSDLVGAPVPRGWLVKAANRMRLGKVAADKKM